MGLPALIGLTNPDALLPPLHSLIPDVKQPVLLWCWQVAHGCRASQARWSTALSETIWCRSHITDAQLSFCCIPHIFILQKHIWDMSMNISDSTAFYVNTALAISIIAVLLYRWSSLIPIFFIIMNSSYLLWFTNEWQCNIQSLSACLTGEIPDSHLWLPEHMTHVPGTLLYPILLYSISLGVIYCTVQYRKQTHLSLCLYLRPFGLQVNQLNVLTFELLFLTSSLHSL